MGPVGEKIVPFIHQDPPVAQLMVKQEADTVQKFVFVIAPVSFKPITEQKRLAKFIIYIYPRFRFQSFVGKPSEPLNKRYFTPLVIK
jgi:hypothetical protein